MGVYLAKCYRGVLRPFLFRFDAEKVHRNFVLIGRVLGRNFFTKRLVRMLFDFEHEMLEQEFFGIKFRNPLGLAAGFDKNGEMISIMQDVGFGFSEVGSITAFPSEGNKGIRLKRITKKKSLWVYLGLNNKGVDLFTEKIKTEKYGIPFGVNVAKTNSKDTIDMKKGIADYIYSLKKLEKNNIGDYYVLNISCPNSYGGTDFCSPLKYESLLKEAVRVKIKKPLFVKISPDLDNRNVDKIFELSEKYGIKGIICSNLTKIGVSKGGFSGMPVKNKSNEQIRYLRRKIKKKKSKIILIGAGGIFSSEDALERIESGADLVQLVTGMIYEGPSLIGEINKGLVELMKKKGYRKISDAVGVRA